MRDAPAAVDRTPEPDISPVTRRVITGESVLINRRDEPGATELLRFGNADRPSASLVFVPIRWEGAPIGLLTVQSYTPRLLRRTRSAAA